MPGGQLDGQAAMADAETVGVGWWRPDPPSTAAAQVPGCITRNGNRGPRRVVRIDARWGPMPDWQEVGNPRGSQ